MGNCRGYLGHCKGMGYMSIYYINIISMLPSYAVEYWQESVEGGPAPTEVYAVILSEYLTPFWRFPSINVVSLSLVVITLSSCTVHRSVTDDSTLV